MVQSQNPILDLWIDQINLPDCHPSCKGKTTEPFHSHTSVSGYTFQSQTCRWHRECFPPSPDVVSTSQGRWRFLKTVTLMQSFMGPAGDLTHSPTVLQTISTQPLASEFW